jgi:hypothetical protein
MNPLNPLNPLKPVHPVHPVAQRHHRVIFVDLARAMAVVMMVYGHTVSALLAPQYRVGRWFDVWVFQRGLTSCLFLLLSGFAFSLATTRHWPTHTKLSPAVFKRARRFSLFIALGYALHFPVYRMSELARVSDERWRSFLAVDVLQLIGVAFLGVQLLVLLVRSRRVFMAVSFLLAMAVIAVTPATWSADWTRSLALPLAAYLSVVAHASRFIGQLPHVFGAVAQESLVIYFVHLCIVYGSIWNVGLAHFYGEALDPLPTVGVVIALVAAMTLLAWHWNRLKHVRPRSARWVSVAAGVLLAAMLI